MTDKDAEMQQRPSDKEKQLSESESPPEPPKREKSLSAAATTADAAAAEKKKNSNRFSSFAQRPEFVPRPTKDSTHMTCLKSLLIVFNLLIWLFGAALLGLGIWVRVDREFWELQTGLDMTQFGKASTIMIAAGAIIMIIGFVGCYGAIALKLWMLILYAIIIVIIIFMEIAIMGIVWASTRDKDTQEEMKRRARKAMQEMSQSETQRYFIDLLQTKLECCGVDGPDDYGDVPKPRSCNDPATTYPREQGCLKKIISYFEGKAGLLGGIAIAVFVLQLAVLIVTMVVACGLRQANKII